MTRLINSNVADMLNQVNQYKKTVQDAFYEHYKNTYVLTETNNFRGEDANAYKEYLKIVTINYINAFINIAEEVSKTLEKMNSNYTSLESYEQGSIDTDILEDVRGNLNSTNESLQLLASEIDSLNNEASNYIYVENLNTPQILGTYSSIDSELCNIYDELTKVDSSSLTEANNLMDRINELTYQLKTISNEYHEDNKISADKVKKITMQEWYKTERTNNLDAIKKEDPFFYDSGAKYGSEGQWAKGYASDTYAYAGYSNWGREYNTTKNKGVTSGSLTAFGYHGYEHAQITKYANQNADISLGNLSLSGKAGLSKDYLGFEAKGKVAVVDATYSTVLGTDKFNGYVNFKASALSANGYINNYVKKNGDFDFGIGGKASAADASVTVGTSILNVPGNNQSKEYAGGKVSVSNSTSLLGLSVTGKAGESVSADFDISNTRVLDWGKINVNALHLKLGGCIGLGANVDVTVPVPTIDMPWED